MEGWYLDKDIIKKGNKYYLLEICFFIFQLINNIFNYFKKSKGGYFVGVCFSR